MTHFNSSILIQSIIELLSEAYDGPADPHTSWFIDNQADAGIFGVLALIPHAAYHLGTIRQMVERVRA